MRSRKLIRGAFLNTVSLVVQVLTGLYLIPLMINAFGDARFGIWVLAMPFMGYGGTLNLGLHSAASRFISQAVGRGGAEGNEAIKTISATAFYTFVAISFLSLFVIFLAIFGAPLFLQGDAQIALFRKLLLILCLHNLLVYPTAVFEGVLEANLRYDLISSIKTLTTLLRALFTVVLITHHYGLVAIAWATAGCGVAAHFTQTLLSRAVDKRTSISPRHFKWVQVKQLFGYGVYAFIGKISNMLRFQTDSFVIALFSGVSLVTPFKIASRLTEFFMEFVSGITGVFNQYFSQEEGKNNFKIIAEKFLFVTKVTAYAAGFIGAMLVLFGKDFVIWWVGPEHAVSYQLLLILTPPTTLALIQGAVFPLLYGISKHKVIVYINTGEGVLNLILSVLLVQKMGIFGVALGTAIPMLIAKLFIQPVYVTRVLQVPLRNYARAVLTPFLKTVVVLFIPWLVTRTYLAPTFPSLMICGTIQTAIFIFFLFFFGFNKLEYEYIAGIFKSRRFEKAPRES